ncbi:MAG: hypothetical protein JNJ80_24750 [Gemmatimonadetes bacterium]|nr:hypothetical protein [Gemmatimonadota bacterium]MCC7132390.1 hypothetical protein [Gemmatimonadales bacterium]
MSTRLVFLLIVVAALGCQDQNRSAQTPAPPPTAVDSAVPRDEALRRFRDGLDSLDELTDGASSRDELIGRFMEAVERADTAELRRLTLTQREFAWIYYPTTPQGLPPYDLAPGLMWFMLETRGRTGLAKLMQERGGQPAKFVRSECDPDPSREGDNLVWGPCAIVRRQPRGDVVTERWFGPIIERRGRFKFINYANKLD